MKASSSSRSAAVPWLGVAVDGGEHAGGLLAAHDADPAVGPGPEEARAKGAAAHAVVAGPERAADQDGELRDLGGGDGGDQLGAVLGDAAGLVLAADHEARDVLQEHQRDLPLAGELDEVGALQRALGEQHAVVGQDRHRIAPDPREAADQGRAVERLELVEVAAVDDAGDHLAHVVGRAHVGAGRCRRAPPGRRPAAGPRRPATSTRLVVFRLATMVRADGERMLVVVGHVVDHAGAAAVGVGAAQFLGRDDLAGGGLHQRRAARKIVPWPRTITVSSLIAGT